MKMQRDLPTSRAGRRVVVSRRAPRGARAARDERDRRGGASCAVLPLRFLRTVQYTDGSFFPIMRLSAAFDGVDSLPVLA